MTHDRKMNTSGDGDMNAGYSWVPNAIAGRFTMRQSAYLIAHNGLNRNIPRYSAISFEGIEHRSACSVKHVDLKTRPPSCSGLKVFLSAFWDYRTHSANLSAALSRECMRI
jgi:hypothetical protein